VRVDEVILPEDPIVADEGGTDRAWVFGGAGALLLVGAGGMGLRRRRRNDQA
jgi:LPXTG-motif cell wall-anchored protein